MLNYKTEVKRIYSKFFNYRNDIDLYVEDEEKDKEFYKLLFQRLLEGSNIKINDVTPLGCRENVINTCLSDSSTDRKKLYIVDGDIYLVSGTNPEGVKNLFVLDAYCIENFVIEEKGILEVLHICIATQPIERLSHILNFDKWLGYNSESLIDLFIHFSIAQENAVGIDFLSAHKFLKTINKETVIDIDKINDYIEHIKSEVQKKITMQEYLEIYNRRNQAWAKTNENLLKLVSGKDYLLPLLQFRFKKVEQSCKAKQSNGLFSRETLKMLLIKHADLTKLEPLKQRIEILK